MAKAMATRCFKQDENDNQKVIKDIISLRHERAKLLGYENHASFVLEERMAEKPKKVFEFIDEIFKYAKPAYDREHKELLEFVKKCNGPVKLEKWDYPYYAEKLKMELYAFDDEMLRPYFKLENVIDGVFQVAKKLFDLDFKQVKNIPLYHADVMTYEVSSNNNFIGLFYADFFPRDGKRAGAWMTQFKGQSKDRRPHISIVCNFTKSTKDKPSLITHDEVRTLFHEFGHALHGLLSDVTYASIGGTNVYWDFVELPSQIMENWAQEKECLDLFARHYETGEKMPDELMKKLHRASTYHEGRMTMRQLSMAHVDMEWHTRDPYSLPDIAALENSIMSRYDLMPTVPNTSISAAFSHIFGGGYSAGYYSYKWAEVLDADAFEFFKEKGLFNKEVADRFKNHILTKGGSEHPMHLYKKFRGHEPKVQPLLKRAGLLGYTQ
jgi:peptidyl-dipeptidase Dcp